MKKSSMLATLGTLGLAVAVATPAMALENEFHGMFSGRFINSNFNQTATTDNNPIAADQLYRPGMNAIDRDNIIANGINGDFDPNHFLLPKRQYSANFIEQRVRLQYIAKANADLKLVTHFEIDYSYWGNSSYTVGRNQGGAQGADTVNLETKSAYLDFNPCKNVNVKMGMQPFSDAFKSVIIDSDVAGVLLSSSYGNFSPSIGYFRFHDVGGSQDRVLGHLNNDMFMLDTKYQVSKNFRVGGAYYFFRDDKSSSPSADVKLHNIGVNAEYTTGPLTLNGFAIYQTGWSNQNPFGNNVYVSSYAANLGAKLKTGPGTARMEMFYVSGSGDDGRNAFYAAPAGEHGFYDNEMVILGRDKNAYTTDNTIIDLTGNRGQGQMGIYMGYDLPVTSKLTTAANVGVAGVAHSNSRKPLIVSNRALTGNTNESNFLGTEINAEANYALFENMTVSLRGAYVFLGDYFKNVALDGTPEDPYDAKLIFKYVF